MGQLSTIGKVATSVRTDDKGVTRVIYHSTPVVTIHPNGKIILNHGGYTTATTKTRMNQAANQFKLGFQVWQKDFAWFVDVDGQTIPFESRELTIRNGADHDCGPLCPTHGDPRDTSIAQPEMQS